MLLNAQNLSVHRGATLLLDGFSCTVAPGEAVWLTGPNGIGKSTLLRVLAGVQASLRGTVGRTGAFVYQPSEAGFDAGLTLLQNLDWWAAVHRARIIKPVAALDAVGIAAHANKPYDALSQGQKQRAALARLTMSDAALWLLDEPLSHLDAAGQALFVGMARAHLQRSGSMVAATHDTGPLPEARTIALAGMDA